MASRAAADAAGTWAMGGLFEHLLTAAKSHGDDGQTAKVEIAKWNSVGPRYGLQSVGPPLPEE